MKNRQNEFVAIDDVKDAIKKAKQLAKDENYEEATLLMTQAVEAQERLYSEANEDWKDNNEKTAKLIKKLEKAIKDWNESADDRAEGDFEDSFKAIVANSEILEKIFVANDVLVGFSS